MTLYRAYIIDSDDEFQNSVSLECVDDEVALKKAKQAIGWRSSCRALAVHPKDSYARPQAAAHIPSMTEFVEWLTGKHKCDCGTNDHPKRHAGQTELIPPNIGIVEGRLRRRPFSFGR
jgi:hypothetical protein